MIILYIQKETEDLQKCIQVGSGSITKSVPWYIYWILWPAGNVAEPPCKRTRPWGKRPCQRGQLFLKVTRSGGTIRILNLSSRTLRPPFCENWGQQFNTSSNEWTMARGPGCLQLVVATKITHIERQFQRRENFWLCADSNTVISKKRKDHRQINLDQATL